MFGEIYCRPQKISYDRNNLDTCSDNRTVQQLPLNQCEEAKSSDQENFRKTSQLFEHLNVEFESSEMANPNQISSSAFEEPYQFESYVPKLTPITVPMFESGEYISSSIEPDHNRRHHVSQFLELRPSKTVADDDSFENELDCRTRLLLGMENHQSPTSRSIHGFQDCARTEVGDQVLI